ncbi:hypothetical protein GCM10023189_19900 [Nibrella saemangeumensis]|uniref:LiaF transmembrane domain-containing protein n=1 Tax=Nibrella saemangeumensis TaxID=1084526 RepID=A0ABP8MRX6_9BACT
MRGLFWGIFIITLGILFLGQNVGWFDIDWGYLARFWPLLLILAGINLILERRGNSAAAVTTVLLAIAVPLALFGFFSKDRFQDRFEYRMDDNDDEAYEEERRESDRSGEIRSNTFSEPMGPDVQEAVLKLEGGASRFVIGQPTSDLIKAETRLSFGTYSMSVDRDPTTRTPTIELKPNEGNIKLKNGKLNNQVDVQLNEKPTWTIDIGMGAGDGDFDLSAYAVNRLKLEAGAADIDVKLGSRADQTDVDIQAGVASVTLRIPQAVGCKVEKEGALNVNNLDGFNKIGGGVFLSPNYDQATKKVNIRFQGGVSKFSVERY